MHRDRHYVRAKDKALDGGRLDISGQRIDAVNRVFDFVDKGFGIDTDFAFYIYLGEPF